MKHSRTHLFTSLFIIAGILLIVSSLDSVEAQSGWPPLDSNCSDGECVFGVSASADDAGPTPTYGFETDWPEIYFGRRPDNSAIVSGLRFANVTLPQNTGIAQAYLVFTVDGTYTTPITVAFYGENSTNAQSFISSSQPANRPRLSGLSTVWSIPSSDTWVQNQIRQSPDITAIVQAIVDKSGWQSGNALAILVEPTSANQAGNYRRVFAYDRYNNNTYSARLVIRTGPRSTYLPLVAKRFPPTKVRSGVHIGNRSNGVWNSPTDFLARLKGTDSGDYPRVAVVLSNQLYNIQRAPTGACNITGAQKLGNTFLYDYLTDAVRTKGTIVAIRIYPSPGNFSDWNNPGPNHNLIYQPDTATPNNGSYCNGNQFNYRAPRDVAQEMKAIYDLNIANGWPADRFFFEPANEPNTEWYLEKGDVIPNVDGQYAWQHLDGYFVAVYDAAKSLNTGIQVLTPPMAQGAFAEYREFGECTLSGIVGYDYMHNTYETKNDGWSWHNYWRSGVEFWQDAFCSPSTIVSDHVFQYFPQWLQSKINLDTCEPTVHA